MTPKLKYPSFPAKQTEWDLQKQESQLYGNLTSEMIAEQLQRRAMLGINAIDDGHEDSDLDTLRARLAGRKRLAPYWIDFDCSQMREVCENMCYANICLGDRPRYELTKNANTAACQAARKLNKCGKKDTLGVDGNGKPAKYNYCS